MTIDDEINEIEVSLGNTLPDKLNSKEIDITDETEISNHMLKMIEDDRNQADKLFDLFYDDLSKGTDRSSASKETIARALELKIEASKGLLELIKAKQKKQSVGIVLNTINEKKAGINISGFNFDEQD